MVVCSLLLAKQVFFFHIESASQLIIISPRAHSEEVRHDQRGFAVTWGLVAARGTARVKAVSEYSVDIGIFHGCSHPWPIADEHVRANSHHPVVVFKPLGTQ
jgi:hypothetical protein